jgi:hypothetical protein
MSSVTILTDDNEIVIIPRHRPSLQLIGGSNCGEASAVQPATVDAFSLNHSTISNATHTKLFADGTLASDGVIDFNRTDHVAVIDHATGLMWAVESIGDEDGDSQDHAACTKACAELRLLGHDDWRLPTRAELVALVDDTRRDPAIDTNLFPRVKPNWHWTSTETAWSSGSAWGVYFGDGLVYGSPRGNYGFALAVRRAGQ